MKSDGDTQTWRALAERSWTLVEHYERDGRQYLVIASDAVGPPGPGVLAPRELQVVASAAVGLTTKVIAHDLGLSDSTVRVLLARAAKKLGVKNRAELSALYLAHVGPAETSSE